MKNYEKLLFLEGLKRIQNNLNLGTLHNLALVSNIFSKLAFG